MKKYTILLIGCSDATKIEVELTKQEMTLIQKIAKEIKSASVSDYQPTMEIYES